MPRTRILLTLALAAALLAGCGSDEGSDAGGSAASTAGAGFPATLQHKYGSTTIEKPPERVVVVGLREQDTLLALGIKPVAATKFFDGTGAIRSWARPKLGGAKPPVELDPTDGIQIERVAAQRPDLIIGMYSAMTKDEYAKLSKVAPTVAQPKGKPDYGEDWAAETVQVGRAVGKEERARALVREGEASIAEAKREHPEFAGKTAAVAAPFQGYFVYGSSDPRPRLLAGLGFELPKEIDPIVKDRYGGQLSAERLDILDVGALVWLADEKAAGKIRDDRVYRKLAVGREGRDVYIGPDDMLYNATSAVTVLNLQPILDRFVPRLAAAADGDPATRTGGG
jgi:iron complex transport system substrate-binding protein